MRAAALAGAAALAAVGAALLFRRDTPQRRAPAGALPWVGGRTKLPGLHSDAPATDAIHLSPLSQRNLAGVHPLLIAIIDRAAATGAPRFEVVSGRRTVDEQIEKVVQGFSQCDPRTGITCPHVIGIAADVVPYNERGELEYERTAPYAPVVEAMQRAAAELGIPLTSGVDFDGDGQRDEDPAHHQIGWRVPDVAAYLSPAPLPELAELAPLEHAPGQLRGPWVDKAGDLFFVRAGSPPELLRPV